MKRALTVVLLITASPALGVEVMSEDCRTLGWHFYCDPEKVDETQPKTPPPPKTAPAPKPDPRDTIKAIRDQLDLLKATAILEPTEDNVAAYIRFQREQLDRASVFSDQWRRTVWQNPDLDYDLIRPTGALAKRAWSDARKQTAAQVLAALPERYGVFYFFKGDCPQCRAMETALKPFIETHGRHTLAVSLDGSPSSAFPDAVTDTGQAARLGVSGDHLPALALFDTVRNTVIPIGFGALAADELERRIYVLTQVEVGHDY